MHPEADAYYNNPNQNHCAQSAFIHASAFVDAPCRIGPYTRVLHFSHIMPMAIIGEHCEIDHHVTIGSGVMIGNHVHVMNNSTLNSGVILENDVTCGPSTVFSVLEHVRSHTTEGTVSVISPTLVKAGAHIGPNTTVAAGYTIGQHAFIEAGSVIDRHIPDFAIAWGNPVQVAGWRCSCGSRLSLTPQSTETVCRCGHCGKQYQRASRYQLVFQQSA